MSIRKAPTLIVSKVGPLVTGVVSVIGCFSSYVAVRGPRANAPSRASPVPIPISTASESAQASRVAQRPEDAGDINRALGSASGVMTVRATAAAELATP
jgi:hypothetical protein